MVVSSTCRPRSSGSLSRRRRSAAERNDLWPHRVTQHRRTLRDRRNRRSTCCRGGRGTSQTDLEFRLPSSGSTRPRRAPVAWARRRPRRPGSSSADTEDSRRCWAGGGSRFLCTSSSRRPSIVCWAAVLCRRLCIYSVFNTGVFRLHGTPAVIQARVLPCLFRVPYGSTPRRASTSNLWLKAFPTSDYYNARKGNATMAEGGANLKEQFLHFQFYNLSSLITAD